MLCRNGIKLNLDPEAKLSQKDLCTAIGGRLQLVRETSLGNFPQKKKKRRKRRVCEVNCSFQVLLLLPQVKV
jgi:hypothetical protein